MVKSREENPVFLKAYGWEIEDITHNLFDQACSPAALQEARRCSYTASIFRSSTSD
jgi:hypothetical protein